MKLKFRLKYIPAFGYFPQVKHGKGNPWRAISKDVAGAYRLHDKKVVNANFSFKTKDGAVEMCAGYVTWAQKRKPQYIEIRIVPKVN